MRPGTERMILTNRTAGPDYIMQIVEERCEGVFDDLIEVMSHQELADFAAGYKRCDEDRCRILHARRGL